MKRCITLALGIVLLASLLSACSVGKCPKCGKFGVLEPNPAAAGQLVASSASASASGVCSDCAENN